MLFAERHNCARARGHYELFLQSSPDKSPESRECFALSRSVFLKRKHTKLVVTAYRSSRRGNLDFSFFYRLRYTSTTAIQPRNYDSAVIDALSLVNQHALAGFILRHSLSRHSLFRHSHAARILFFSSINRKRYSA